jgi:hypothetical protein
MEDQKRLIAVCGLDCTDCPLRLAHTDAEAAQQILDWFRDQGWVSRGETVSGIMQRGPYCSGCHGDHSVHWSADCWILQCCVDGKGLSYCYECDLFPCQRLSDWADQSPRYSEALDRLHGLKDAAA